MGRSPRGHPLRVLGGLTCEEVRVAALWPGRCFWGVSGSEPRVPWALGPGGLDDTNALCSQAAAVPTPLGCRKSRERGEKAQPQKEGWSRVIGKCSRAPGPSGGVVSSVVPVIPPNLKSSFLPPLPTPHAPRAPSRGSRGTCRFEDPFLSHFTADKTEDMRG